MISATYTDAAGTSVAANIDGAVWHMAAASIAARDGQISTLVADWLAAGNQIAPYVPPAPTEADYSAAIEALIDQTAIARGYADGVSLMTYKSSSVATWAAEATAFAAWRDAVWTYAYGELAKVQAGTRTPQPSVAQIVSELPTITWPA